jgi:IclR family pca regulon transcriptional regulator
MTLIDLEFVASDGKHYWLTPRVLRLGLTYLATLPYWREAQLALEELCGRIKQSCALSVLDGDEIVYIQRQHASRILAMSPTLGSRLPAHAVSMGRVMLANLSEVALEEYLSQATLAQLTPATITDPVVLKQRIVSARGDGYSWVDGELDESICGLAVPVRDANGSTIAAINVSLLSGQQNEAEAVQRFLPELRQAASRLRATTR